MKILLTTPDALLDNQRKQFFPRLLQVLNEFNKSEQTLIIVVSRSGKGLDKIPKEFNPIHLKNELRGSPKLIEYLKKQFDVDTKDFIVLAAKDKDVQQAANSKLLLLRAKYAFENNPGELLYEKKYGIPIESSIALGNFFKTFTDFNGEWYYQVEVSEKTKMYALTDANTFNKSQSEIDINNFFKQCLKDGDATYRMPFMVYFLVSTYGIVKEFEKVDYWGIYPSSGTGPNMDLEYFKDKARQSYKGISKEPIIIRHTPAVKRQGRPAAKRIEEACDLQLLTVRLNPYYENKLKGKTVCIIDDFTTYGTSCETARNLLEKAGVAKLIFITLGKFGKEYHKYNYNIVGDPFGDFKASKLNHTTLTGTFNYKGNSEFIQTLGQLMK
ncbi:phosphoribosyltransferase [Chitinophaga sp.]|uniref:phosphoribosyltransferase n=1 Tax=Chitinophaga sp. TaxID=1869181 RepID=UPI0031D03D02